MAKVVLPLLGVKAHGTVGGAITYRGGVGLTTAARYKRQRDVQSPAQLAQRSRFSEAVTLWPLICQPARLVLLALAGFRHLNAWNWFLGLVLRDALPSGRVDDCFVGDFRVVG